ncbi:hypothetical protein ACFL5Z_17925 [Planctomycetota bacterium]
MDGADEPKKIMIANGERLETEESTELAVGNYDVILDLTVDILQFFIIVCQIFRYGAILF